MTLRVRFIKQLWPIQEDDNLILGNFYEVEDFEKDLTPDEGICIFDGSGSASFLSAGEWEWEVAK